MISPISLDFPAAGSGTRRLSPTDISQFIRLDQCRRYLRLRLHERASGGGFMRDYGVVPQSIPPLLTRSGAEFEQAIEQAIPAELHPHRVGETDKGSRSDVNADVVAEAQRLLPGEVVVLFQPRLDVEVAGWRIRGDLDILRLECHADGSLHALITDMKSSTTAKVEHRLQVAFYHEMLDALFAQAGVAVAGIETAILYRGPASGDVGLSTEEAELAERERAAALHAFGTNLGRLEHITDADTYIGAVRDLVTDGRSIAMQVVQMPFEKVPYHLTYKCDGCLYNEFCMKWSAEHDDLSLLPHLTEHEKSALQHAEIMTTRQLARLKEFAPPVDGSGTPRDLVPVPGQEALARQLAGTWPIGPRLDELIHRARRYRKWKREPLEALNYIPSKGYGSLPYTDADHNPNLVRIYVDAQHDYLNDRIYLLGALVVACEDGVEQPERRTAIVRMTDGPPETAEAEQRLFVDWIKQTLTAVVALAAPDGAGKSRAPVHFIFFNSFEQRILLDGLARHFGAIFGATPLYDFLTQLAAFDSPVATFLDREMRELKNYPMVCQSLQVVAEYLKFNWDAPQPYREIFRTRLFDFWGKFDRSPVDGEGQPLESPWYTSRARFNSQIPLEYAYAAWDKLDGQPGKADAYAAYREATPELLQAFHHRRLEALEHIVHTFQGNRYTEHSSFDLPELDSFSERARTLAHALDEFVTIERHVFLNSWKSARLAPPERRVLAGETLIVHYDPVLDPEFAEQNREHLRRQQLKQAYDEQYLAAHPTAKRINLSAVQKAEVKWSHEEMRIRIRLDCSQVDCDPAKVLSLTTMRVGDRVVMLPRWDVDSRLPAAEQVPYTPTAKQMLYGMRADIIALGLDPDDPGQGYVDLRFVASRGGSWSRGFVFSSFDKPLVENTSYTLDPDPNDWSGYYSAKVTEGLCSIASGSTGTNTLYERLVDPTTAQAAWPQAAVAGQRRFLDGLDALEKLGALSGFEPSKVAYIGGQGDEPTLLVQGPPGTGKSYGTAFALLSRMQGAMAAGQTFRSFVSCHTHAAIDVLLNKIHDVQQDLRSWHLKYPDLFAAYFDARLLDAPLFRAQPKQTPPDGVTVLVKPYDRPKGSPDSLTLIDAEQWCVVAATPGAIYGMLKEQEKLFTAQPCDCLVLDEASQLNLPSAMMAALPLKPQGQLIVVGDHRQMAPIIKHDWSNEPRRTFREYRAYESLFLTLLGQHPAMIKFEQSFRLHADMATFLRKAIYEQDHIPYYSLRTGILSPHDFQDPFVRAVLAPVYPIIVVVHDEDRSQLSNPFEEALITPILEALAASGGYNLDSRTGLGVVVPHRAQRASLQEHIACLSERDSVTQMITHSAVDTVERFQGDERQVILVSATESDPAYLQAAGQFLLDPRRLTVAMSRAKQKMVLVAARSVFSYLSTDEETFANAQLWKNLLRRTCTVPLWSGDRDGVQVEVWGNAQVELFRQ